MRFKVGTMQKNGDNEVVLTDTLDTAQAIARSFKAQGFEDITIEKLSPPEEARSE